MKKQIIFICETCTRRNEMEASGIESHKVEYESLTEAFKHLLDTNTNYLDIIHEMKAVIKEAE